VLVAPAMYNDSTRTGTNLDLFTDSPWPPELARKGACSM